MCLIFRSLLHQLRHHIKTAFLLSLILQDGRQCSVCTFGYCCFIIIAVVDIVAMLVREGVLSEMLYVDDFVLMSETLVELKNEFGI